MPWVRVPLDWHVSCSFSLSFRDIHISSKLLYRATWTSSNHFWNTSESILDIFQATRNMRFSSEKLSSVTQHSSFPILSPSSQARIGREIFYLLYPSISRKRLTQLFCIPLILLPRTFLTRVFSLITSLCWTNVTLNTGRGPREWREWKSIESISFKVAAPDDGKLTWKFPFGSSPSLVKTSYQLTHDRAIDISINWPVYSQRSAHGGYRGELQLLQGVGDEHRHYVSLIIIIFVPFFLTRLGCWKFFDSGTAVQHDIFEPSLQSRWLLVFYRFCFGSLQCRLVANWEI